jgi:hypothetical protein
VFFYGKDIIGLLGKNYQLKNLKDNSRNQSVGKDLKADF